ncbi:MAG: DUF3416 domain-containing protein [Aquiluna sp.]|nr:DUF3416 domain-containing protein [Aquiluna sp.]
MTHGDIRITRLPIVSTWPVVDDGNFAVKAFVTEVLEFGATATREGHDQLAAELVLESPSGEETRSRMFPGSPGMDQFFVKQQVSEMGIWKYRVTTWDDKFATWHHTAVIKLAAGIDQSLVMLEGQQLANELLAAAGAKDKKILKAVIACLGDENETPLQKFESSIALGFAQAANNSPLRPLASSSKPVRILCERKLSGSGSWYEFFPRSEGATKDKKGLWTSGTFKTATKSLTRVKDMGFEVLYLPPIHPIGEAHRKGPNNTLVAQGDDPGSPWAIGSSAGGHDTIHPDLGSEKDFANFVKSANKLGIEIAMDFALQASPDHPWVKSNPQWFAKRADGSIAYAENPPKKYQDIFPIFFDEDPEGLVEEVLGILTKWIGLGVKIFRVDNPHTKPVSFWQEVIEKINEQHPEVIFLAEAFTRPAMMHALAKAGFQQSYTYFTWRNSKNELAEYFRELSQDSADFFRPNLWVNTPDILSEYIQFGGRPAFKIRATIAATAGSSWGMYAGFELYEAVARPGAEENIDNEKFEYKKRDFLAAEKSGASLAPRISLLNKLRAEHPCLGQLRNLLVHESADAAVLVYSKHLEAEFNQGVPDTIIVVVNTDPTSTRETTVTIDLRALGLPEEFQVKDLVTGKIYQWGAQNYVKLDSFEEPAHIFEVMQ